MFKRREKALLTDRVREALAPRKGFWRGFGYIGKRMRRVPDTPHRIALGFACGAFVSFSPFFTLHFVLAAIVAWMLRGNILSSLFGTAVGNPFTFPFIAVASIYTGRTILGTEGGALKFDQMMEAFGHAFGTIWDAAISIFGYPVPSYAGLSDFFYQVFLPYLVGGILPGAVCAAICYYLILPIVTRYQRRRRIKLAEVQARHRAALDAELDSYKSSDGRAGDNA